jgi:hypothetical protein
MTNTDSVLQLTDLFDRAAHAHHQAFLATHGEDPDWAAWYARWLLDPLGRALDRAYTVDELTQMLEAAEQQKLARAPTADWRAYYAGFFLELAHPESAR